MRIEFRRSALIPRSADATWSVISDVTRVVGCLPGLERFDDQGDGRYVAVVVDKVGPFKVRMEIDMSINTDEAKKQVEVRMVAADRRTNTRMTGTLVGWVAESTDAVSLEVDGTADVLGPIASLGAGSVRRRTEQVFEQTMACMVEAIGEPDRDAWDRVE